MNTTTTTQNTAANRCEDMTNFDKRFIDLFRKLTPEDQQKFEAAVKAAVKIDNATPEQVKAICGRLGVDTDPSAYIFTLFRNDDEPVLWAACEAVDDVTEHKTIDELRAIRAAREGGQR